MRRSLLFLTLLLIGAFTFGQNVVPNPSFDTDSDVNGEPDDWTIGKWDNGIPIMNYSTETTNVHAGGSTASACLDVFSPAVAYPDASGRIETANPLIFAENTVYAYSFWVYFSPTNGNNSEQRQLRLYLQKRDGGYVTLIERTVTENELPDGQWAEIKGQFSTHGASAADLANGYYFAIQTGRYPSKVYIDDVDISPTTDYLTYSGTSSFNFTDDANWVGGVAPTATDNVYIPSVTKNPLIKGDVTVANLIVQDATLKVQAGKSLTVTNQVQTSGSLKLQLFWSQSGIGTLIFNGNPNATIQHEFAVSSGAGWQPFASGLSNSQSGGNASWAGSASLYLRTSAAGAFGYESVTGTLPHDKGMLVYTTEQNTFTAKGNISGYETAFNLLADAAGTGNKGFYLLPNTHTAHLDLSKITVPAANYEQAVWVYNSTTEQFDEMPLTGILRAGYSFFVRATSDGGEISLDKDARTHSLSKKNHRVENCINVQVSDGTFSDKATLRFNANATEGKDNYDLTKMFSMKADRLSVFSLAENNLVGTNTFPTDFEGSIPVKVRIGESGVATLSLNKENLPNVQATVTVNGVETELSSTFSHNFTGGTGDEKTVWVNIGKKALSVNNELQQAFSIKHFGRTLIVNGLETNGSVELYNLQGALISTESLDNSRNELELTVPAGVYLVKVKSGAESASQKIAIQ